MAKCACVRGFIVNEFRWRWPAQTFIADNYNMMKIRVALACAVAVQCAFWL